jgi:hypothetical protein
MAGGLQANGFKEVREDWVDETNIGTSATTAGVKWMNSSDAGNTAFAITDGADGPQAIGATDATDDDMCEISHRALSWSVQNGTLEMETRVQVSVGAVGSIAFTVGFNDDQLEDSNTLPVELATATFTSNASSFVGIVYDADATNQNVHAFWVDDDNDANETLANLRFVGMTPVLAKYLGIRIALKDRGSGLGVRAEITVVDESTGRFMQKTFNTSLDRDALLAPHIAFENRAGVAHTFVIDYIYVRQTRAAYST